MRITFKNLVLAVAGLMLAAPAGQSQAGVVVAATGVSSPQGNYGGLYDISNSITASSGLSQSYIDGVTDFQALVTTATYSGYGGATAEPNGALPQDYIFDLGSARTIDAIGLWASSIPGDGSPTLFGLYSGSSVTGSLLGTFSSTGGQANAPGQQFSFAATTTQYVLLRVLAYDTSLNYDATIGQVVFDSAVPEPTSIALCGIGALGLIFARRKRQQGKLNA